LPLFYWWLSLAKGVSGKPPNGCKIKLLSLEVIFMAIRKDSPQKAAMR